MDLLHWWQQTVLEGRGSLITSFPSVKCAIPCLYRYVCAFLFSFIQIFSGNKASFETKINTFYPPVIGRYIRLHPITWHNTATVRMEFYGCELDGRILLYVGICTQVKNMFLLMSYWVLMLGGRIWISVSGNSERIHLWTFLVDKNALKGLYSRFLHF